MPIILGFAPAKINEFITKIIQESKVEVRHIELDFINPSDGIEIDLTLRPIAPGDYPQFSMRLYGEQKDQFIKLLLEEQNARSVSREL